MDFRFEEDKELDKTIIDVMVRSHSLTPTVQQFLDYIGVYQTETPAMIPIKTIDRIEMLRVEELILVDVEGNSLLLETTKGRIVITERLYRFQERLRNPDFVQVSKHALINIHHLEYLEDGFSGTMTAFLSNNIKTSVSRKFLKNLATRLGL